MEEKTFRRLLAGTKEAIKAEASEQNKSDTQWFRDMVEPLRKKWAKK